MDDRMEKLMIKLTVAAEHNVVIRTALEAFKVGNMPLEEVLSVALLVLDRDIKQLNDKLFKLVQSSTGNLNHVK